MNIRFNTLNMIDIWQSYRVL